MIRACQVALAGPALRFAGLRYALLLACVAFPARAVDVKYAVAVTTDVRARTGLPGDAKPENLTSDLELLPRAEVTLGDATSFFFQYAPTLLWREPQTGGRLLPLHRARLAFTNRWERATLLLSEDGAYGMADIGSLRSADGSLPGAVAEVQTLGTVPYLRSATLLGLETRPTDLVSLGFSGGFTISGSQEETIALPLQYGPSGAVHLGVKVSRTDGLTTLGQVSSAHFVTGAEQLVSLLSESWDRQLNRTMVLVLGAGAALTREVVPVRTPPLATDPTPGTYLDLLPVGTAALGWSDVLAGRPLKLDGSLRIAPFADRFTGNVYERLEARLAGEWKPARYWTATAAGGGAIALPLGASLVRPAELTVDATKQTGDRLVFGEGAVTWAAQPWLQLQASARVLWTEQPRTGAPGVVQAVGTVSVTVIEQDSLAW